MTSPTELSDAELGFLEEALDDNELVKRINFLLIGPTHPEPEGETFAERAQAVICTIERQLRSGTPSRIALAYIQHCLQRHISGEALSLDQAFYLRQQKAIGGQKVPDELERDVVRAYMSVIRKHCWTFDPQCECEIYHPPTKEVNREAYEAAYIAYRRAADKPVEDFDREKKIEQTIKKILRRKNVLR